MGEAHHGPFNGHQSHQSFDNIYVRGNVLQAHVFEAHHSMFILRMNIENGELPWSELRF